MKWTNKGHEFDAMGSVFIAHRNLYIYGVSDHSYLLARHLRFLGCPLYFVDETIERPLEDHVPLSALRDASDKLIVIPDCQPTREETLASLLQIGYVENETVFIERIFLGQFLPVFAVYAYNKVYFPHISFLPTTVCNLNCEKCLVFTPYNKQKRHRPLEELKRDVDTFFQHVDYIGLFHVSGGEPFLYPHLGELLTYIAERHESHIYVLGVVTNGTVIPSDALCRVFQKYHIQVQPDDYTRTLLKIKPSFDALIAKLCAYEIIPQITVVNEWIDLFPPKEDMSAWSSEQLEERFCKCGVPFTELRDCKLYSCNYAAYAMTAGLIVEEENDYFDLLTEPPELKKALIEFRMRYNVKGFVDFCKYCNGFPCMNPHTVSPASQATGPLTWDGKKEEDGAR